MANTTVAKKKILYVEDDEASQCLMECIMDEMGYGLVVVAGGKQAADKVKTERFDLILMDVRIPGLNGYETTREIRKTNREIPIIACTAHIMPWVPEKCKEAGMDGFIEKPIDITKFQTIVNTYLESE